MSTRATATFEITSWEESAYAETQGAPKLSRATVRKRFQGDFAGESTAELLMAQSNDGAAGYVGMERFVGQIGDRAGSFDLQHCATQGGSVPQALWLIVPGSGTGALHGISGEASYQHDERGAVFTLDYAID